VSTPAAPKSDQYEPLPLGKVQMTVDKVEHGRGGHHVIEAVGMMDGGGMVRVTVRMRCARRNVPYQADDEFFMYFEPRVVSNPSTHP
jgi:hypothetical protein